MTCFELYRSFELNVVLQQIYSRKNSGDGLLVDLSIEIIKEAWPDAVVSFAANDKESFSDLDLVDQVRATQGGGQRCFKCGLQFSLFAAVENLGHQGSFAKL